MPFLVMAAAAARPGLLHTRAAALGGSVRCLLLGRDVPTAANADRTPAANTLAPWAPYSVGGSTSHIGTWGRSRGRGPAARSAPALRAVGGVGVLGLADYSPRIS